MALEVVFWLLLLLAVYSYFVYPLKLAALCKLRAPPQVRMDADASMPMTLIVTAYNEEARIREKIRNTLAIDYPNIELIVASDCSTDRTDDIVGEYVHQGVRLVRADER